MKKIFNIILLITLSLSVLFISSFEQKVPENSVEKTAASDKDADKKTEKVKHLVFEATTSACYEFTPIKLFVLSSTAYVAPSEEWVEIIITPSLQEFFKIFFNHIIAKNAP